MELLILDLENVTEDELKKGIQQNCNTMSFMRSEIEKLKAVAEKAQKTKQIQKEASVEEKQPIIEQYVRNETDEDFEDEVEYYYSSFIKLTKEQLQDEDSVLETLPVRKNYRYKEILYRMKANILKQICEIKNFIFEVELTPSELQEFQEEILFEQEKLKVLDNQLNKKEEELLSEEKSDNKIIFVPTYSGNFHIFDEIEQSSQEYYDNYYSLFQSIKDGTFKGVKRFKNDETLKGICEVKENKVRIIFSRLSHDSYAILSAFVKKTTNDAGYRASLRNRAMDFYNAEEQLRSNLDNQEFLELNSQYEQELYNMLNVTSKEVQLKNTNKGGK